MIGSIKEKWRVLSGNDNWKDLLDPLDIDLRRYIIHYGERAQQPMMHSIEVRRQTSEVFPKATSVKVHRGWLSVYCSSDEKCAREQVLDEVERLLGVYDAEEEEVSKTITSHTIGAALSLLNAADIVVNGFQQAEGFSQ
ncbi:Lipase 3 domain-containing protein [Citrus sinensis]|uniref:Lipase 3 domain-containing protein n=1 Tax=Citrus sinensis TaxID=2711 RepID=A0ACB8N098_CITSI|nr:Lipase 3 domain-containing protein [Citrus sinensis]